MTSNQSEIYLQKSLETVTRYIRGELNLDEAVQRLEELGHVKKSILKVLKDTDRNNLINFKTKRRLGDEHLHEYNED